MVGPWPRPSGAPWRVDCSSRPEDLHRCWYSSSRRHCSTGPPPTRLVQRFTFSVFFNLKNGFWTWFTMHKVKWRHKTYGLNTDNDNIKCPGIFNTACNCLVICILQQCYNVNGPFCFNKLTDWVEVSSGYYYYYYHSRWTAFFPGQPGWAGTKNVKTSPDLNEGRMRWYQLDHMQTVCTSPRSRQITTPTPHHSIFYRPGALPDAQPGYRLPHEINHYYYYYSRLGVKLVYQVSTKLLFS